MGRHGENIHYRKDGRWEGRCSKTVNGMRKSYSVYAGSYLEAKRKLADKKREIEKAANAGDISITAENSLCLHTAASEWLESVFRRCKKSTYEKYRYIYFHYIYEKLGNIRLTQIKTELAEEKLTMNLSANTVKSIYCVLNRIFSYAQIHYHISEHRLKTSGKLKAAEQIRVFNDWEQSRLLSYLIKGIPSDKNKLGIYLCLSTGLRLGEVCALRWSDIDLEQNMLRVRRSVQRISVEGEKQRTQLIESSPKTACSQRSIPLSDALSFLLKKYQNNELYFLGGNHPMEPRTYQYRFARMLKEAGIHHKNFHVLRHTFATNCINSGADVKCVSEILGHSSVSITLNRYVHPSESRKRACMNAIAVNYGQTVGQAALITA